MTEPRKLKVFLCHASQDKAIVRALYGRLNAENWIDPWLDEEKLLPGQDWDLEIEKAVEASDAVIVCISTRSVSKEGYVQKELRKVLDIALEKPEETIFIIPVRLDDCELPRRLRAWHYVDYFPEERRDWAFRRLLESLKVRYTKGSSQIGNDEKIDPAASKFIPQESEQLNKSPSFTPQIKLDLKGRVDLIGLLLLIVYLFLEALLYLGDSNTFLDYLKLVLAVFTGLYFIFRRQVPVSRVFRATFSIFLVSYSVVHYLAQREGVVDIAWPILGIVAMVAGGSLIAALQPPTKTAPYSSIVIASYFFLVAVELVFQATGYYESSIFLVQILLSIVISILLWMDL